MNKFTLNSLFLFLFIFLSYPALAQKSITDSTIVLDEVTIHENRFEIPFNEASRNISILTKEDFQRLPVQSVPEILSYLGSVDIRQRGVHGTSADISIRGGGFEQTLVLLNGIRLVDPQTGHHNLAIPLHFMSIDRIEVLRGAGARAYGQNAFSGVVNILTEVPRDRKVMFRGYGGDFGSFGGGLGIALPGKTFSQQASISYDESDGYRFNTDYTTFQAFYQSELMALGGKFNLTGGFSDRKFGANGFYASPDFVDQYEEVQTSVLGLDYEYEQATYRIKARTYWRRNQDDYVFLRQDPLFFRNLHKSHVIGTEIHANFQNPLGNTGIGFENRNEKLNSTNLGDRQRTNYGIYLEHRFSLFNDLLTSTAGIYMNYYSDFGWQGFPGIDLGLKVSEPLRLYASVNRTYRVPTFTEWFYEDRSSRGNPDLVPEESINYEGGLRFQKPGIRWEANYFFQDASNVVDWIKFFEDDKWNARNIQDIETQGLETNIQVDFPRLFSPNFFIQRANLSYTFIDAQFSVDEEALQSRYVLENLRHQMIFGLDHRIYKDIYNFVKVRYLDRASLPNYWVLDIRVAWQKNGKSIFAEATNVTNTAYTETNLVPMPSRWFRAGIQWELGF